jgi:hypothetical protein
MAIVDMREGRDVVVVGLHGGQAFSAKALGAHQFGVTRECCFHSRVENQRGGLWFRLADRVE